MLTTGIVTALSLAGLARAAVNSTTCGGKSYSYNALAGYGFIPGTDRDSVGDTIGGIGSAIAIKPESWTRHANGSYTGVLFAQPDRGWNTNGTLNYNSRVQTFQIVLTPNTSATASSPSPPNLQFYYLSTLLHKDPTGEPTTGLDPTTERTFSGFPALPIANYTGDGFGGNGTGGSRVPIDAEGLVYNADGSFWTSDEYGPYIYKFGSDGTMLAAIRPPNAFIPLRNGSDSFSANSPPIYAPDQSPNPGDPTQGRANNQGFEGFDISSDGKILTVLLQSALIQEGGTSKSNNFNARLLRYDISGNSPSLVGEYVVVLPTYTRANGNTRTAAQSEIHDVGNGQFFVLSRDSGAGRANGGTTQSLYRHIDIFDITNATNLASTKSSMSSVNNFNQSIASSKGKLNSGITPTTYCSFLDFNVNSELNKFGVHNGGDDNSSLLNEKWESIAVVPQLDTSSNQVGGKWFVLSLSDDDFITQNGYMNGGKLQYADATGASLDNQALVFDVTLPSDAQPWRAPAASY